jgi:5'-deoxynucleotidase YfbR-like HD superfamily hydrolase
MHHEDDIPLARRVAKEVDLILWSGKLSELCRFKNRDFWEQENVDREYAGRVEGSPRLESVADHSWHMADTVLLIAHNFPPLDMGKCLIFAVLHDKLEIIMDDKDAVGRGGTGKRSHAFNPIIKKRKEELEREALERYSKKLNGEARRVQGSILLEYSEGKSREARFVRAIDKLDAITFIIRKKKGDMKDAHIRFTLKYAQAAIVYFPEIEPYFRELAHRLLLSVAKFRRLSIEEIERIASEEQLEIPLNF